MYVFDEKPEFGRALIRRHRQARERGEPAQRRQPVRRIVVAGRIDGRDHQLGGIDIRCAVQFEDRPKDTRQRGGNHDFPAMQHAEGEGFEIDADARRMIHLFGHEKTLPVFWPDPTVARGPCGDSKAY